MKKKPRHVKQQLIKKKLKPCPFCGGKVRLKDVPYTDFGSNAVTCYKAVIECKKCKVGMAKFPERGYGVTDEQKEALIDGWNTRFVGRKVEEQTTPEPIEMENFVAYFITNENIRTLKFQAENKSKANEKLFKMYPILKINGLSEVLTEEQASNKRNDRFARNTLRALKKALEQINKRENT